MTGLWIFSVHPAAFVASISLVVWSGRFQNL